MTTRFKKTDPVVVGTCPICGAESQGNYKHRPGLFKCSGKNCHNVYADYTGVLPAKQFENKWVIYTPEPGTREFEKAIFFAKHFNGVSVELTQNKKFQSRIVGHMRGMYKFLRLATDDEIVMARLTGEID